MSPCKSVSPACNIRLVMPEGLGDLSGSIFVISFSISPGVNGAINKGCVKVVAVKACSFSLGRNLATSCALFLSYGESLSGCWKSWLPRANLHQCQLRGLRVAGPCFQIRLSKDALEYVFWGSEEVFFSRKVAPHRVVLLVSRSHIVGCILCDSEN